MPGVTADHARETLSSPRIPRDLLPSGWVGSSGAASPGRGVTSGSERDPLVVNDGGDLQMAPKAFYVRRQSRQEHVAFALDARHGRLGPLHRPRKLDLSELSNPAQLAQGVADLLGDYLGAPMNSATS